MLHDLQLWFTNDLETTVSLIMAAVTIFGLAIFYFWARTKKKEQDAYEEYLAEEFKLAKNIEPELTLPVVDLPEDVFELPEVKKTVRKKAVKKTVNKPAAKKPAKKKTVKDAASKKQ